MEIKNRISAKDAYNKAKMIISNDVKKQLEDIYDNIYVAYVDGNFSTIYYEALYSETQDFLENDGYKIEVNNFRNEINVNISWEHFDIVN